MNAPDMDTFSGDVPEINGYAGQRIFVLPEQDACIAVTSHEFNSGSISDCVWNHIVPQLK